MASRSINPDVRSWTDSVPLKHALAVIADASGVGWKTAFRWWRKGKLGLRVKWRCATRVEIFRDSLDEALIAAANQRTNAPVAQMDRAAVS